MSRVLVDSGIKWIGSLPNTWSITTVNKIFYRRKEVNDVENPTVLSLARDGVKIRDISTNEGQLAESYDNYHKVYKDDLMINPMDLISGANCSMSEIEGVISPAYINLASKANIYPKYYDYFFKYQYWIKAMFAHGKGVSFNNRWTINWETMASYKLPYPKLSEQREISKFLDKKCLIIDKTINNNNKEIELLEEYKVSIISNAIDSENKYNTKLKRHVTYIKGYAFNSINFTKRGIPVVMVGNMKENTITDVENYINEDAFYKKYLLLKDDLIISTVGSNPTVINSAVGKVSIIPERYNNSYLNQNMAKLIANDNLETKYLFYIFKTKRCREYLNLIAHGTANQSSINVADILDYRLFFPPLEKQKNIIKKLDKQCSKLDEVINYRKQIIEKLEEYKRSLIYECVTGKREV